METIIKICFSVIIGMILWAFVQTIEHSANFRKGLENHLLNNVFLKQEKVNSMLHSKVMNTRNVESNNKSFK